MRVLIVEDEYITRTFLSNIIDWEMENMTLVGVCKDGIEALNILAKENIDIVLTDLKMPKMDGNKLIKELKKRKFEGKIIVLSNYNDFNMVKESMKDGAFEYLLKVTINKDELLSILKKAKDELIQQKKLIRNYNDLKVADEKLKISEYMQKYLAKNEITQIDKNLIKKYLIDYTFIYFRVMGIDTNSTEKEKRVNSFISNIISSCSFNINSDIFSHINIKRNEHAIVLKGNKKEEDIEILIESIKRNAKQYLNIEFEKIMYKQCKTLEESLLLVQNERKKVDYKINSKVIDCRYEIKKVIEYINENLEKKISLDNLASLINMNESYLSRIFKDELKITISDYIKLTRLEKAKELLRLNDMRIKDVARSVGIQDQLYFSRLFTKQYNMTPSDYKEKYTRM